MNEPLAAPFSCFVTGTDTGVGKTLVAAALLHGQARRGWRVAGMKPVAAGAQRAPGPGDGAWRNEDVECLAAAGNLAVPRSALCPYLLEHAVAPHIAAQLAGVTLDLQVIVQAYGALRDLADAVVVEGVGGFRVPLGPGCDTADLACRLGLPVVLVVGMRLGCLNHAALSAEAIAARGLRLAGWVANAIDPEMAQFERNVESLATLLAAPCLGRVPHLRGPAFEEAARYLDAAPLWPGAALAVTARGGSR
jgi:dethiobiotin synthetase